MPSHFPPITLIADSGSSGNYTTLDLPVVNQRPSSCPVTIQLPNGKQIVSIHEAELDIPMLLPAAQHVHLVPGLQNCSLLSIGQLCDSGYEVKFTSTHMTVLLDDQCILQGHCSASTKLWHVSSTTPAPTIPVPINFTAAAISTTPKAANLVAFAHATLGALVNGYPKFPGLTLLTLRKHPPHSIDTIKGHLDQTRQNQRSTQLPPIIPDHAPTLPCPIDTDVRPTDNEIHTHMCYAAVMAPTGQI